MPTVSGSPGALFLPVRLDVGSAEKDLIALGRAYNNILTGEKLDTAGFRAVNKDLTAIAAKYERIFGALKGPGPRDSSGNRKPAAPTPNQFGVTVLPKNFLDTNPALATTAARLKLIAQQSKEVAKQESVARKEAEKFADAQGRAAKETDKVASATKRAADEYSGLRGTFRLLSAGSQELFTGLGAARSGNYFYGLAAASRYAKNVNAEFAGMSTAARAAGSSVSLAGAGMAAGLIGVAAAAALVYAGIAKVTYEFGVFGTTASLEVQGVRSQFEGLLGSAEAAAKELEWINQLVLQSTVPSDSIYALDQSLIVAGMSDQAARETNARAVATLATGLRLTADEVGRVVYQLSQTLSTGTANSVDFRQLGNNRINVSELKQVIAQNEGVTVAVVNEMISSGQLTADILLRGIQTYSQQYAGAAAAALTTVAGLRQTIGETLSTGVGMAFDKAGVSTAISGIFKTVLTLVQDIAANVEPTAAAFSDFFQVVSNGFASIVGTTGTQGGASSLIAQLFGVVIPKAVGVATTVVKFFVTAFNIVKPAILSFVQNMGRAFAASQGLYESLAPLLGGVFIAGLAVFATALNLVALAAVVTTKVVYSLAQNLIGLVKVLALDWEGAAQNFKTGLDAIGGIGGDVETALLGIGESVDTLINADFSALESQMVANANAIGGAADAMGGAVDDLMLLSPQVQEGITSLNKSFDSFAGGRNDFLKAFTGAATGFTATGEQILAAGKSFAEGLSFIDDPAARKQIIGRFELDVQQLAYLADRILAVQERLQKAKDKYQSLVQERNSFRQGLIDGFTSWMSSVTTNEKQVTEYVRISENGYAGWVSVTKTTNESMVDALAERRKIFAQYARDMRTLMKRGLDEDLLKSLFAAGPEQGGEMAAALASASDAELAQINKDAAWIRKEGKKLAKAGGDVIWGEAINAAKQTVDVLQGEYDNLVAAGVQMAEAIESGFKVLGPRLVQYAKAAAQEVTTAWSDELAAAGVLLSGGEVAPTGNANSSGSANTSLYGKPRSFWSDVAPATPSVSAMTPVMPQGPTVNTDIATRYLPDALQPTAPNVLVDVHIGNEQLDGYVTRVYDDRNQWEAARVASRSRARK